MLGIGMMLILLVVVCFALWLLNLSRRRREFEALYKLIKISAPRLPIIGHLCIILCSDEEKMKKISMLGREAIDLGGIAGFWLGHKLYIHVADSEVADILLKRCLDKDDSMNCFHIITGDGSIFTSVAKWRPRRKYLASTFSMKNLKCYVKVFSELSGIIVEKIKEQIAEGKGGIRMEKVYLNYSMNAICGSLGIELKAHNNTHHPFLLALEEVLSALITRVFQPWLYSDFVYKLTPRYQQVKHHKRVVFEMFHKAIEEKRKEIEKTHNTSSKDTLESAKLKSFITLMVESPANISDVAIREECIVLVAAASDTSAVSLWFVTLMLAKYPEEQEKIYNELKEVIGDLNKPITPTDLPHLKYLDAFIRETLRLYPAVSLTVRKTVQNVELPSGITLVPGCGVVLNIWAINRNPKYWGDDAERFRPARFLEKRNPAAFATFSYGPRNCMGSQYAMMLLKTVTATILGQFRVEAASEALKRDEPLRTKYDFVMKVSDDYKVRFETR